MYVRGYDYMGFISEYGGKKTVSNQMIFSLWIKQYRILPAI